MLKVEPVREKQTRYATVIGTEPAVTPLLDKVKGFSLRFYSGSVWLNEWSNSQKLPKAIEVTVELEDFGAIRRLFLVAVEEGS